MDSKLTQYADAIYQHAVGESAQELGRCKSACLHQIAARNPSSNLPFSGPSLQMIQQCYVRHLDRCIEAGLESYQRAYGDAKSVPTDQELMEVWKNVQEAQEHQIRHSVQSLRQFMGARGLQWDPTDNLRAQSAHAHDRALGKWKIWRSQVHLLAKPEVANLPLLPKPEIVKPSLLDKSLYVRWAAILWPLGSVLLSVILAVAIEQYPEFFRRDTWILPVCTWAAIPCWIIPLLFHERAKRWYRRVSSIPRVGMVVAPVFALAFLVFLFLGSVKLLRFHRSHLADALKREQVSPQPGHGNGQVAGPLSRDATIPVTGTNTSAAEVNGRQGDQQIELIFKDSPLFTASRRARITKDASRANSYLKRIGIDIPQAIPPIGIDTRDPKAGGYSSSFDGPKYYYNEITVQPMTLDKDQGVTQAFISYDVGLYINNALEQAAGNSATTSQKDPLSAERQRGMMYVMVASLTIEEYLNHSLWGRGFSKEKEIGCPEGFWGIRTRYGQQFTDRLAAFVLRALSDDPYGDISQPFDEYFRERVQKADSVIDNENSKFPAIEAILQECRWPKIP